MNHRDILHSVFAFDELNVRQMPPSRRTHLSEWLLDNPSQWRLEESLIPLDTEGQIAIILTGEEGAGKTTELRILLDRIRKDSAWLPVFLDMTSCPDSSAPSFWSYARRLIERSVAAAGNFMEYRAAFIREEISSGFHSFYALQQKHRGDFSKLSDDNLLNDQDIHLACAVYESALPVEADKIAFSAAQALSKRALFMIDNTDLLGTSNVRAIARHVSGSIMGDTFLVVATRPGNHHTWKTELNERRHHKTVPLDSNTDRLFKIARKRLSAAKSYSLENSPQSVTGIQGYANKIAATFVEIQSNRSTSRLVSDWHNRSVRQMLPSLLATTREYLKSNASESLHGVIFRTLVRDAMPHSMVELYTPTWCNVTHAEPFVFLRLRIMSYLNRRIKADPPTLGKIKSDFKNAFGVAPLDVEDAVIDLLSSIERTSMLNEESADDIGVDNEDPQGALLRLERSLSYDDIDNAKVVLQSAGSLMIKEVIKSCDFLSWVYDRTNRVRSVAQDDMPLSQAKLNKAVEVVDCHILPLLLEEHKPYMESGLDAYPGRRVPLRTRARLDRYRTMFGYETGHWFIGDLAYALGRYAEDRPDRVRDTVALDRLLERIDLYIQNLDAILTSSSRQ